MLWFIIVVRQNNSGFPESMKVNLLTSTQNNLETLTLEGAFIQIIPTLPLSFPLEKNTACPYDQTPRYEGRTQYLVPKNLPNVHVPNINVILY